MSPTHETVKQLPEEILREVKKQLPVRSKEYKRALQVGFFVNRVNGGYDIRDVYQLGGHITGYLMSEAKNSSHLHFVKGVTNTRRSIRSRSAMEKKNEDRTLDNADPDSTSQDAEYRGKHRSHTRGPQSLNFFGSLVDSVRKHGFLDVFKHRKLE